jgi:hypothetical protein
MFDLVKRLRAAPETSAALHDTLREIEAALPAARAALADAEQDRAGLLLTGDDRSVVAAEAVIQRARIDLDRLVAASGEAARRAAEAEAREKREALDAERSAVEKRAAAVAKRLISEYGKHAGALVDLLQESVDADAMVAAVNAKLMEARRDDLIRPVEERAVPIGPHGMIRNVLRDCTSLLPIDGSPGWGFGRGYAAVHGFKA